MGALVGHLRGIVAETFGAVEPETAEVALGPAAFRRLASAARKRASDDPETDRLWCAVFDAVGCGHGTALPGSHDPAFSTRRPGVRRPLHARSAAAPRFLGVEHRRADQLVGRRFFPLDPGRTMAVFPDLWARPVANNSATWSFDTLQRELAEDPASDYSMLPVCTVPVDWSRATPVLVDPGDLVAFSADHLHASIPNRTGRARISAETRTVSAADLEAGRGAPLPDAAGPETRLQLVFSNVRTGRPLTV